MVGDAWIEVSLPGSVVEGGAVRRCRAIPGMPNGPFCAFICNADLLHKIMPTRVSKAVRPRNLRWYGKSPVNDDSKPFAVMVSIAEAGM
jgi:hypothetical protein